MPGKKNRTGKKEMENKKQWLILEAVLAALVILVAVAMLQKKNGEEQDKISIIVQNSDDYQWSAFKYGLKMASDDSKVEMFVVNVDGSLTVEDERILIEQEMENGADGIILQPVPGEESNKLLRRLQKKIPLIFIESTEFSEEEFPVVQPDNYEMGRILGEELLKDYNGSLKDKEIGFFADRGESETVRERVEGFQDAIENTGARISWSVSDLEEKEIEKTLELKPRVDFVICFDDYSFTQAGEVSSANNLHGALIYGIGHSTEAMYYVDTGIAESVIVPDEFNMGYQSFTELACKIQNMFYSVRNRKVSHTVIRRENLFSEENQELLFTMSQ